MEDPKTLDYGCLYAEFKRHKQYLQNVSPATIEGYDWAWKAFADVFKGTAAISKADIVAHIARLRDGGLSPVTINTYLRSFNTFFRWLETEGYCDHLIKIPRLKEVQKVIQSFSKTEVRLLISFKTALAAEARMHTIACLILDTGARIDEVLSSERKNVDLDNLLFKIREGKGGKERVVPMSIQMRKLLFVHMRQKPAYGDLLFFTCEGEKIDQRNALRVFKTLCRRLDIVAPRCSFHTLRHTFGKTYIRNGGDVFRLQKILGHAKLEMTHKYVNLETSDLQKVHQQFSVLAQAGK